MTFGTRNRPPADPAPAEPQAATPAVAREAAPSAPAPTAADTPAPTPARAPVAADTHEALIRSSKFDAIRSAVFASMNMSAALMKTRDEVRAGIEQVAAHTVERERLKITAGEQVLIVDAILNDMFGVGPIEPLLADDSVTDILVNGRPGLRRARGPARLTSLKFRDDAHVASVAQRIAAAVGRRVDESSPMVDARLADGSRVNVVLPPIAMRGPSISIRKFAKRDITLARMAQQGNISHPMLQVLKVACACRLNIVISGGTGSGKTTLLNALSQHIEQHERIVTIEDAAELQLLQPHVVSLETRPENTEGPAGSRSAISCATRCGCGPTASSSARFAAPRRSTCCRR